MPDLFIRRRNAIWMLASGLWLYFIFLAISAPASIAGWAVGRVSQGKIVLEGARDSLWEGRADSILVSIDSQSQRFTRLAWTLNARSLLRGEFSVALTLDDPLARGQVTLGWRPGSVRMSAAALEVACVTLAPYAPVLEIANLRGKILLRADNLVLAHDNKVTGAADIEWKDAGSGLSSVALLGSYRAKVQGDGSKAQLTVATQEGALQVAGSGSWARETGVRFEGTARAAPGREADLRDLLRLMGPETSSGVHAIRLGSFSPGRA